MTLRDALAAAKEEAEKIPAGRKEKLDAAFDTAAREALQHSAFRRR